MNRDDIVRMAREAEGEEGFPDIWTMHIEDLERFAALVAAAVANEPRVVLERGDVAMERYLKRIERMKTEGWRQCAVGQRTTQFCGQLEAAVAAEREACARLAEDHATGIHGHDKHGYGDAIRARGNDADATDN